MLHKILKRSAWVLAAIIGLACLLYGVAVAVNWKDRPPSPTALRLDEIYSSRPTVADEDNAFVFLMGFKADLADDPFELGVKRTAWLRQANAQQPASATDDPLGDRGAGTEYESELVRSFNAACRSESYVKCAELLEQSAAIFDAWVSERPELLSRYTQLIRRRGWSEVAPAAPDLPLASYGGAMDGQRLLLLRAAMLTQSGDSDGALELMNADVRFWRMVLASADLLITKMIAAAALNRDFELGSLVLRSMQGDAAGLVPSEWLHAFSSEEISMRRCVVGEWIFMKGTMQSVVDNGVAWEDSTWFHRAQLAISRPLFKRQDTINKLAEYYASAAEMSAPSLTAYAKFVAELDELADAEPSSPPTIYNPIGSLLKDDGHASFGGYAARTADLEGVRRAALAAAELRRSRTPTDKIAHALQRSSWRNPYNGAPMEWREHERAIVFTGLSRGDRREHRIYH
jgi:hypothetical protein